MRFWVGLAVVSILMVGTLYLFVIRPSTGGPGGYHMSCAPDLSSCIDEAY